MRILYVGAWLNYRKDFYNDTGSPIARDQDVPKALAQRGHEVHLLAAPGGDNELAGPVTVVGATGLDVSSYDLVILVPEYGYWTLRRETDQGEALRKHPNVIAVCDQWLPRHDDVDFARVYMPSSACTAGVYKARYPMREHTLLPWAITEFERYPDPWADVAPKRRAVFCGCITDRDVSLLNTVAETETEVWVAGFYSRRDGRYAGFTDEERLTVFHPRVRFMSELPWVREAYPYPFHGPLRYGLQAAFYQHADLALCFGREASRRGCVTSKLYDYLGEGLPTVVEQFTANGGDVVALDAGTIFRYDDPAALADAAGREPPAGEKMLDAQGGMVSRRDRIRLEARVVLGTWADRARTIEAYAR